jgi:hypothetical protein
MGIGKETVMRKVKGSGIVTGYLMDSGRDYLREIAKDLQKKKD